MYIYSYKLNVGSFGEAFCHNSNEGANCMSRNNEETNLQSTDNSNRILLAMPLFDASALYCLSSQSVFVL